MTRISILLVKNPASFRPVFFLLSILGLLVAGCSSQDLPLSTLAVRPSPTTTLTFTATPLPTGTPNSTATPSPTRTPLPSATFTITPTALPWAKTVISAENAGQLAMIKSWERGGIQMIVRVGEDRVVVLSTTGVYVYQESGPYLLSAFPAALQFLASPDARLIAVIMPDGTVKIVRLEDGQVLNDIAPVGDLPVFQQERYEKAQLDQMKKEYYSRASLAFSEDSNLFALAYIGGTIGVWKMEDGALLAKLSHHVAEWINQIVFTPDGTKILSKGSTAIPEKVLCWSIAEEKLLWYQSDSGWILSELFSPDGSMFGLSYGQYFQLYSFKDGSLIGQVKGGTYQHPYSQDSSLIVTVDPAGVMLWQVQPKFLKIRTLYLDFPVYSTEFSEDGTELILNGGQRTYRVEDYSIVSEGAAAVDSKAPVPVDVDLFEAQGHLGNPIGMNLTAELSLFVWGGGQRAWRWEPFSNQAQWADFANRPMADPAISSDAGRITACSDKNLEIYDFGKGTLSAFERCLANGIVEISPDGKMLVWAQGSNLHTVSAQDGSRVQDFVGSGLGITWLKFSGTGNLLASGGQVCGFGCTGDIHLWKINPPGGVSLESEQTDWVVSDVVFSADEQWMYVAKRFIWIWDAKTGALKGRLPGEGSVLALSPDGGILAVGEWSGKVSLIDTSRRVELAAIQVDDTEIIDMLFTPDGHNLVTLSAAGSVRLWGVP